MAQHTNRPEGLLFSRKVGESFVIGEDVRVVVESIGKDRIQVRVVAPPSVRILRSELLVPRVPAQREPVDEVSA